MTIISQYDVIYQLITIEYVLDAKNKIIIMIKLFKKLQPSNWKNWLLIEFLSKIINK